ncbi:MAG: hypothetical protein L0154_25775 [Chloroflexi bacterium]|nr:hypothetical protein [Chloroflexota bacterium]
MANQQQIFGILLVISVIVAAAMVGLTAYLLLIADDQDTALITGVIAMSFLLDSVALSWLLRRAERGSQT